MYVGRKPSYAEEQISEVVALTGQDKGVSPVASELGVSRATIYQVLKSPAEAFASVKAWS